jgi:hypothetical protein
VTVGIPNRTYRPTRNAARKLPIVRTPGDRFDSEALDAVFGVDPRNRTEPALAEQMRRAHREHVEATGEPPDHELRLK